MEAKGAFILSVLFFVGGFGGMFHQKILKIRCSEMLFPAISVIYLLRSLVLNILYSYASNIAESIHFLFMIRFAISHNS